MLWHSPLHSYDGGFHTCSVYKMFYGYSLAQPLRQVVEKKQMTEGFDLLLFLSLSFYGIVICDYLQHLLLCVWVTWRVASPRKLLWLLVSQILHYIVVPWYLKQ